MDQARDNHCGLGRGCVYVPSKLAGDHVSVHRTKDAGLSKTKRPPTAAAKRNDGSTSTSLVKVGPDSLRR